jgi:hypothetical protein
VLYNASTSKEELLVLHDLRTDTARVLSRTGDAIPGQPGEVFRYFSPQNWIDGGNIVFRAASVKPQEVKHSTRGIYAWRGIDWKRAAEPRPEQLITVADPLTTVPAQALGTQFHDYRSAPVTQRYVAFSGGGKNFRGVYFFDLQQPESGVRMVVDTGSQLQGLMPRPFTGFAQFCTVFDQSIVFVGYAGDDFCGVFLYRIDRDELFLLTDNRAKMGVKQITDFEIAGHFLVRNRFAVTVHFDDKTSGVYMATVPDWSYKRMSTAAAR